MSDNAVISVKNLKTYFYTNERCNRAINGVSMDIKSGKTLCIVGESGCGKSVTATSIMQLLPKLSRIEEGEIIYHSGDKRGDIKIHELERNGKEMRDIRGKDIAMIFQDPMTSLNALITVGAQISEAILEHEKISKKEAMERAAEMLRLVGIPDPEERLHCYPHEFSGGMRQRVMIAMALSCRPELLIADEPTTALDVTIQAQILRLLKELKERTNTAVILITHDLGVVASSCSRIIVMYGGQIMETGTVEDIFYSPLHPYTIGLLQSIPKAGGSRERLSSIAGTPPDMLKPPTGCPFYPRCEFAMHICREREVPDIPAGGDHMVRCWLCHSQAPAVEKYEMQKGGVKRGQSASD